MVLSQTALKEKKIEKRQVEEERKEKRKEKAPEENFSFLFLNCLIQY
jgi:hypothetical protein